MLRLLDVNKKAFINILPDNRIHLFDLETGKEKHSFVERDHLSHQYTCIAWSRTGGNSNSNSNGSATVAKYGCLAIGTSDSKVLVFDLDRGVVKNTFDVEGVPLDISYSSSNSSIYLVFAGSSSVQKISSSSGSVVATIKAGKRGILKVRCQPNTENTIACANSTIRICSAENAGSSGGGVGGRDSKEAVLMKINTSFPGGITVLEYSSCGKYIACCGIGSKELLIYSIEDSKDGGDSKEPISVIALDHIPVSIPSFQSTVTKSNSENLSNLFLFVVMENHNACVIKSNGIANSSIAFDSSVIKLSGSNTLVLGGSLGSASNPKSVATVTVALGNYKRPYFLELSLTSDGVYLSTVNLPAQSSSASSSSSSASSSNPSFSTNVHESVQVLGPLDAGLVKRPYINIDSNSSNNNGSNNSNSNADSSQESDAKKMKIGGDGNKFDAYSQIFERRIDNISSPIGKWISATIASKKSSDSEISDSLFDAGTSPESLLTSIEQALQSGDSQLLDKCIFFTSSIDSLLSSSSTSKSIIEETCKSLPATKVVPFLKKLVSKFENNPSFGDVLTFWLTSTLKFHCNHISTTGHDLHRQLGSLSGLIDQRLTTYNRFASLGGRVDLLLSQSTGSTSAM